MTDVVTYDVVPRAGVIDLGKQVEGLVTRVVLPNIRRGEGAVQLVHQRSDDQKPYLVPITEDGDKVYWIVNRLDTAYPGRGQAELQWLGVNDEVAKSVTYQTNTTRSMAEPGAVPDEPLKPYTQAVAKDAQAAKNAAASATEAALSAGASAGQAGLSAATATEAARKAEAIVGQAGQSAQSAQAAAIAAAQNAAAAGTAEAGAKQAQAGAEAASSEAQTAKTAAEKDAQEAKTAQAGAVEAKTGAETAQAKAEKTAQGLAADREQIRANTAGLEAAQQDVTTLKAETTALKAESTTLKAETARTARSLDYLWKKSKGIIYDTETVTGAGSSVTVPSGAMDYAALRKLGGMSQRDAENNVLIDAKVDEVRVQGRNLIDITTIPDTRLNATYITVLSRDATHGTLSLVFRYQYQQCGIVLDAISGTQYTLSFGWTADNAKSVEARAYIWLDDALGSQISSAVNANGNCVFTFLVPANGSIAVWFRPMGAFSADNSCTITISELQLTLSAAQMAYAPYREPVTYPIPQTIRDMCPDYGQGTVDAYNYIDFTAKTYHHVGSMSQDGTWTALATPEVIDLSAVWPDDDFGVLQVEAGGTIGLHYPALDNGFELAVPSETEIMVDVAKVVQTNG